MRYADNTYITTENKVLLLRLKTGSIKQKSNEYERKGTKTIESNKTKRKNTKFYQIKSKGCGVRQSTRVFTRNS